MKKIFGLFSLMLGLLSFVSCSNEVLDNPYAKVSSISIDSVSVLFQAAPSTGFVKVTAPKGITKVVSEQSWCTPTVNGSEVSVQVEGNSNVLGRSSLLTIYSGDDYAQVTVQQMGLIFALDVRAIVSSNDNALTKQYAFKTNADVVITSSADWLQATVSGNLLTINATANNSGQMRKGYVYYTIGAAKDSIPVVQYDFDKDIAGKYQLFYKEKEDATDWYYVETILSRDSLSMPTLGLRMPISFDEQTCSVSLKCGQYCGKYEASYIYSAFLLGDDSWSGYGSDITASGTFDYDHAEGVQYCAIDRSTSELPFKGIMLVTCSSQSFTSSTVTGVFLNFYSPILQKVPATSGAKASLLFSSFRRNP